MKKVKTLKQKIIFYVMSVSVLLTLLIIAVMSASSIRSTNAIMEENIQLTARIASQNIGSNLHLLTERMYNISKETVFQKDDFAENAKQLRIDKIKEEIEFIWLSAYNTEGQKMYGDENAPSAIADTEYFKEIEKTGNMVIGEPYSDGTMLQLCVIAPLKTENAITGYLVGSYKYDLLNDVLSMLILGDTGCTSIVNEEGQIIGDINKENIIEKKNVYELYPAKNNKKIYDKMLAHQTGCGTIKLGRVKHYAGYAPVPGTNWSLLIHAPKMEFIDTVIFSIAFASAMAVILILIAAASITPVAKRISEALLSATKRLQGLADGDLSTEVVLSDATEEIGILTEGLSKMVASLKEYIQEIQSCLGAMAEGDYRVLVSDSFSGDFTSIKDSLSLIVSSLNKAMFRMQDSSLEVNKNSLEASDYAKQLHDGSVEQLTLMEELEESMVAMIGSIEETRSNAEEIEACCKNADEKTAQGDSYMQTMLDTMHQIENSMDEISKISQLIEGIADQTSLLALNASIEAARAGEAGRGFSVVANEIGGLSNQTADALKQTAEIIEKATSIIASGQKTAGDTAKAFREIKAVTEQYSVISEKLSADVNEQTDIVTLIGTELASVSEIANQNQELAEQTDHTASSSLEQSEKLKDYVLQVKLNENLGEEAEE